MLSHLKKKTPHRCHFEIIPKRCEGIHGTLGEVSVVCESGSKISYTEPAPLQDDGTAEFGNVMRMISTIYKQDHMLLAKPYTFKVQLIQEANGRRLSEQQRRKTIARAQLNMADFCSHTSVPAAAEVLVPLQPQGALCLFVKAVWLQHHQQHGPSPAAAETDSAERSSLTQSSFDNDAASVESGSAGCGQAAVDSQHAAAVGNRTSSANLSPLTDYHLHVNGIARKQQVELDRVIDEALAEQHAEQQQQQGNAAQQITGISEALAARIAPPASNGSSGAGLLSSSSLQTPSTQQQQQQRAPASMASSIASIVGRGGRQRRSGSPVSSSQSATALAHIDPILEAEREGHDGAPYVLSSLDRALSEEALQAHLQAVGSDNPFRPADSMVSSSPVPSAGLHQLQQQRQQQQWATGVYDAGVAAAADESAGQRGSSGHFAGWLWPFSRDYAKGATTDELMRQISASAKDAPKLQQLCRGLLVERNDWRYKATQWERNSQTLQEQVDALNSTKVMLVNQLQAAESQLAQLQKDALLDELVETKMQLAQSELHNAELQGQLAREQDRSRKLAAGFKVLQNKFERMGSQHTTVQPQPQPQPQQQYKKASERMSTGEDTSRRRGDQRQGEGRTSPAVDASTLLSSQRSGDVSGNGAAFANGAGGGGRGWGQWIRSGSFASRNSSASSQLAQ